MHFLVLLDWTKDYFDSRVWEFRHNLDEVTPVHNNESERAG